jgi:branched-chain amino acid aminotransferase
MKNLRGEQVNQKRYPRFMFYGQEIVPYDQARVHVLTPAVKYGAIVFEGLRAYWNATREELYVFRMADHFRRLADSLKVARIVQPMTAMQLADHLLALIRVNELREDIHIRVQVFVDADDGSMAIGEPTCVAMATMPMGRLLPPDGVNVQVSSWARISDRSMPPRVKAVANYHNARLALMQAKLDGYDDAIMLTTAGKVAEGPGYTVLGIQDGRIVAPTVTDSILEGITRNTIFRLAQDHLGITIQERSVDRSELYLLDELFFCGSGAEITPIVSVDRHIVGTGHPGSVTCRLRDFYISQVQGERGDEYGWLTPTWAGTSVERGEHPHPREQVDAPDHRVTRSSS